MPENDPKNTPSTPPLDDETAYTCIGVCIVDPDSGLCQGCGRPLAEPSIPNPETGA